MNKLISIIVTVYNKEKTIDRCLQSLLNQTYNNIEIICINDGSTDSSLKRIQSIARYDKRIKIYNQKNKGVSYARNRGISLCSGDYFLFIDGDDWLDKTCCEILIETLALKPNTNVILYDYINVYNKSVYKINRVKNFIKKYHKTFFNLNETPEIIYITASSCQQLFQKEFILNNNIRFPEANLNTEDLFFWISVLLSNRKLEFLKQNFYYYDKTVSNSRSKDLYKNIRDAFTSFKLLQKTNIYINSTNHVKKVIVSYYLLMILNSWSSINDKETINILNNDINDFLKNNSEFKLLPKSNHIFLLFKFKYIYKFFRKLILLIIKREI